MLEFLTSQDWYLNDESLKSYFSDLIYWNIKCCVSINKTGTLIYHNSKL